MVDLTSLRIAVPNGLLFVRDSNVRELPDLDDEQASFWSTSTCIMIASEIDCEGETSITIGSANDVVQNRPPAFDRTLRTPSRKLIVEIVPGETVHEAAISTDITRIRIWTDGNHRVAETVVIGIG